MSYTHLLKSAARAIALALLAACGGNDTAVSSSNVSFASAAMVVPAGQASKSIALTGCTAELRAGSVPVAVSVSPTWVIYANGDSVVTAGLGAATSATEFVRVNDATA